jgi:putative ABC transport system permease protein
MNDIFRSLDNAFVAFFSDYVNVVYLAVSLFAVVLGIAYWHHFVLVLKSMRRNLIRSIMVSLAVMLLVFVITMVWTVVGALDRFTQEKAMNPKAVVTERWSLPSQMPFSYETELSEGAAREPGDIRPTDSMSWQFYGGTIDKSDKVTFENLIFFFCMDPKKLLRFENGKPISMFDDIDQFSSSDLQALSAACDEMDKDPTKVVVGVDRLAMLHKQVGDRIVVSSSKFNYPDIDLEVTIIASLPKGRYAQNAFMNRRYLNQSLDNYKTKRGKPHPMADRSLNLEWLQVPDHEALNRVSDQIHRSPSFKAPAVKCETASSAIGAWLAPYQSLIWGLKYVVVTAILATMALVIACAISIGVRERWTEMAILKVLGFGPNHVMMLILSEAVLLGVVSGLMSALFTIVIFNYCFGGINFSVAFFPTFPVPWQALRWGVLTGGLTGFVGSIVPAFAARGVKVSEVFAKVA